MKNLKKYIIAFLIILGANYSLGQDTIKKLSLADAITFALDNNYQVQISKLNEEIAAKNNKWSEAGLYPTFTLNGGVYNSIQDNSNNPFTLPGQSGKFWNMQVNPTINMDWTVFSGLGVKFSKQRLEQLEQQTNGNSMVVIENTIHQVMLAYYNATLQKIKLDLISENLEFSRTQVAYYELKKEYNQSNSLDLLQFQNQYYTDSSNYVMQEYAYKNATRNLNLLMILPIDQMYEFTDKMPEDDKLFDYENVEELTLSNNQNLKNQFINLELQKTNTQYSKSFLYPVISVSANAGPSWGWFRQLGDPPPGQEITTIRTNTINYGLNLNLRYTIFNNWKSKRAVAVSKIQEEIAEKNIEEMTYSLKNNLANFYELYRNRKQLKDVQAKNIDYSQKVYEMGIDQFKSNLINSIQLTQLKNNRQNAMMSYYESKYNLIETYLEIYKLSGAIVQKYEDRQSK